ncbi:MAG: NAD-dependent epimerase/dehydratase family protein [Lachnospiraceae bacterium]|jgi:nucleoside-diphosphate-sugar epimerase|nr:NAD-dependent epimerase/dehydratase family protein [Lachnospiraceae bacterium]
MAIYDSKTYIADIQRVLENFDFQRVLKDKSVLITGASGLICSSIADILFFLNETYNTNIQVYVAGRNEEKMAVRFTKFQNRPYYHYVYYDATQQNKFPSKVNYIIHGASNAYPSKYQSYPVETMLANFSALRELLEYSRMCGAERLLFISSSEIYGKKNNDKPYLEDEYGYIDILNVKSCYSNSKRAAETLCTCYSKEYNVNSIIVRPGHIYGPTASRSDTRVSSAFAFDAADGKKIILKSDGKQVRSYCYMLDAATAILSVILYGNNNEAYNISNPGSIVCIKDMAEIYAKVAGVNLSFDIPSSDEKKQFNPMNNSSLDSKKLLSIGWLGLFNAPTGFEHTIKIIKEANL